MWGEGGDGVGGDALGVAEGTDSLMGGSFQADGGNRQVGGVGEVLLHGIELGGDFGFLGDDGKVEVKEVIAGIGCVPDGQAEKVQGIGIFPAGIGIGEKVADIRKSGGTEDGIGGGVAEDIGVGVAEEAARMIESNAGEDKGAVFGEAVDIVAEADAERRLV